MEGDAGASQLNSADADDSSFVHVTVENSSESEVGADQTSPEVTAEDSAESDGRAATEVTAEDSATADDISEAGPAPAGVERGPSRLGRRWFAGIAVALLLLAGGIGAGGYFALLAHRHSQNVARAEAAAIVAAKDCVGATQA